MKIVRWLLALLAYAVLLAQTMAAKLKIGVFSKVTTLDPHYFQLTSNIGIDMLVYSTLVSHDLTLKIVPDLAVSWRPFTGPYRAVKWVPGDRTILERHEEYLGARSEWDRVIYRPITNDAARVAALLGGDVDLIGNVPANDVADLKANPAFAVSSMPSTRCYFWMLDLDREHLTGSHRRRQQADDEKSVQGHPRAARHVDGRSIGRP